MRHALRLAIFALGLSWSTIATIATAAPSESLTLFGEAKYKPGFTHTDYVNHTAPKGGTLKRASSGSYDSLNPFILKGIPAPGIALLYESLMAKSSDEPSSYYGLIAKTIDVAADNSSATFTLRRSAQWHDGTPITAADVVFSHSILTTKGHPAYRMLLSPIEKVEALGKKQVRFTFSNSKNRENATIAASMAILPKHYYTEGESGGTAPFEKTTLTPPLGSGPYKIGKVDQGRSVSYERVKNYWAQELPIRKGLNNFDEIRYDIYRDETVALEAFKSGTYDLRNEYISRNWATAYDVPAVNDGRIRKENIPHQLPNGMQGFIFNLRKHKFSDARVREAISLAMDFEWMNGALFYGAYERSWSFFQNTQFMGEGLPSEDELALLEPFRESLPPALFEKPFTIPPTDGSGHARDHLIRAQELLNEAGWKMGEDGQRYHETTGEPLTLEFLMRQRTFQRVIALMQKNLDRLGIASKFRYVDDAQYQKRIDARDFDMISIWWNRGLFFPGQEQVAFWHSSAAETQGSNNYSGMQNPAIDALLDEIMAAKTLPQLSAAARALDRTLLWNYVVIPHWHIPHHRVAWWDKFGIPAYQPPYDLNVMAWWEENN